MQPKYKIVYSFPVELSEFWESSSEKAVDRKTPVSMRVSIRTPHIESTREATLDVKADALIFSYPELYYLDLKLGYLVDPDRGNARFDKSKSVLELTLPVTGVSESSASLIEKERDVFRRAEENRKKEFDEAVQRDEEERSRKAREEEAARSKELLDEGIGGGDEKSSKAPVNKGPVSIQDLSAYGGGSSSVSDQYLFETPVDREKLKAETAEEGEEGQEPAEEENRTRRFLKVYSEKPDAEGEEPEEPGELKEVRYKREEEQEAREEREAPKIEEIKSEAVPGSVETRAESSRPETSAATLSRADKPLVFDEGVFSEQEEFAFVLLNVKGYSETQSRFYLNAGYLFVEIERDAEIRRCSILLEGESVPETTASSV